MSSVYLLFFVDLYDLLVLQEQIQFTLTFANRLISNKDAHPASLVQLFDVVQNRLECLRSRAERLIMDSPPSADALEAANCPTDVSDLSAWRKATLGWRMIANTRALFFGNWNPEDLARHSGQVAWLPKPNAEKDLQNVGSKHLPVKSETDSIESRSANKVKTNGSAKPDVVSFPTIYVSLLCGQYYPIVLAEFTGEAFQFLYLWLLTWY